MAAKTTTIKGGAGKKPVKFKKGALHSELGVAQGKKIPASKMKAAASGKDGPLAKKRAMFAENMLAKGRRTANANRKGK